MDSTEAALWWLCAASVVMFVASLLAIPAIITRLPADYFNHEWRRAAKPAGTPRVLYYGWLVLKNLIGAVLVAMGIAMLVLPGQGVLSVLIGLSLLNFPGKYHVERYIVSRKVVFRSLNWIRRRANKPPFRTPRRPLARSHTVPAATDSRPVPTE